jgi:aminoglycoside phosphotransferase (APT) family kinase protein
MTTGAELVEVRAAHRFDEAVLASYLAGRLDGFAPPLDVRQFEGGQSNPTFLLEAAGRSWVLRKKPPGKLLATAHQVEREYRVLSALEGSRVPVPRPLLICEDAQLIGTPFYVMSHVEGRIFRDPTLPGLSQDERGAIYSEMIRVLSEVHNFDWRRAGLDDFGKPGSYVARQIARWTKQYQSSRVEELPAMDRLIAYLPEHVPADDTTTLVHGDFRLDNMIFHPSEPRALALLDWELATLGHPLSDVAYSCMVYHVELLHRPSLRGVAGGVSGIPSESAYLAAYCHLTGQSGIPHFNFYLAFSLFRSAAILQGVYARGLQGNASSERALELGSLVRVLADAALGLVEQEASGS